MRFQTRTALHVMRNEIYHNLIMLLTLLIQRNENIMIARIILGCGGVTFLSVLLKNIVHNLQANLKAALLSQSVEYRGAFLTALVEVLTPEEESLGLSRLYFPEFEQMGLQECVELLLTDLESDRGGPALISSALCAVSLLLSQR